MTRVILLLLCLTAAGCATRSPHGTERPDVLRDAQGYAIASCLTHQPQAFLKDQGDAWASAIVQRMKGDVEALSGIAEQVARETASGEMAVIRSELSPTTDKPLPLLYCGEIIDKPAVRQAIQRAITELGPFYGP